MMQEYISKTWLLQQMETAPVVEFDTTEHDRMVRWAKWHPADERPPMYVECDGVETPFEMSAPLLVCIQKDGLKPFITIAQFEDDGGEGYTGWVAPLGDTLEDVTHWRYLPRLPKEVDGDD